MEVLQNFSGDWCIAERDAVGHMFRRNYIGYAKHEAIAHFKEELKKHNQEYFFNVA